METWMWVALAGIIAFGLLLFGTTKISTRKGGKPKSKKLPK